MDSGFESREDSIAWMATQARHRRLAQEQRRRLARAAVVASGILIAAGTAVAMWAETRPHPARAAHDAAPTPARIAAAAASVPTPAWCVPVNTPGLVIG